MYYGSDPISEISIKRLQSMQTPLYRYWICYTDEHTHFLADRSGDVGSMFWMIDSNLREALVNHRDVASRHTISFKRHSQRCMIHHISLSLLFLFRGNRSYYSPCISCSRHACWMFCTAWSSIFRQVGPRIMEWHKTWLLYTAFIDTEWTHVALRGSGLEGMRLVIRLVGLCKGRYICHSSSQFL